MDSLLQTEVLQTRWLSIGHSRSLDSLRREEKRREVTLFFPSGTVLLSLNIQHPSVRYELLTAFDYLQQSGNDSSSIVVRS